MSRSYSVVKLTLNVAMHDLAPEITHLLEENLDLRGAGLRTSPTDAWPRWSHELCVASLRAVATTLSFRQHRLIATRPYDLRMIPAVSEGLHEEFSPPRCEE